MGKKSSPAAPDAEPLVTDLYSPIAAPTPWLCLGLALLVLVPYAQVGYHEHEFIVCDDDAYVYKNPVVAAGLTREGVKWAFREPHAGNWHPLTWISHMADVSMFGLDQGKPSEGDKASVPAKPVPAKPWLDHGGHHHLVNVFFHAAAVVLLFLAMRLMTGAVWPSAALAAIFALHPLRVESVAWVAERKDVLSGFFCFLTMLAYGWYARRPGIIQYMLVFVSLALGLMAKSMLVTLPCALLLLDFWPLRRWSWTSDSSGKNESQTDRFPRRWGLWLLLEKVPLVALSVAASAMAIRGQYSGNALNSLDGMSPGVRIANAMTAYLSYLGKMIWPANLAVFYPHPAELYRSADERWAMIFRPGLLAGLTLLVITGLLIWLGRRRPYLLVGWFWYLGTLVPVIGLVQVGIQGMADRYTYMPMVGICFIVVWGAVELTGRWPILRWVFPPLTLGIVFACTWLTYIHVSYWRDSYRLFRHATEVTANNYFAYNHIGLAFDRDGKADEATEQFKKTLEINPSYAFGNSNLAVCYARKGEFLKAEPHLLIALRNNPRYADAHGNLAVVYINLGRFEEALQHLKAALGEQPYNAGYYVNLGLLFTRADRPAQALEAYNQAIQLGAAAPAYYGLGCAHTQLGHLDEAVLALETAIKLQPDDAQSFFVLAIVRFQQGNKALAAELLRRALQLNPKHEPARQALQQLEGMGVR